jgi:hypothetical protein
MNSIGTLIIIVVAFAIGYKIVSWIYDRLKGTPGPTPRTAQDDSEFGPGRDQFSRGQTDGQSHSSDDGGRRPAYEDPETRYARVLGLPRAFTAAEVKERYRILIASYHPDKVNHLGRELQDMAR